MKNLKYFGTKYYAWKIGINLKISVNIADFWVQTVLILQDQNVLNLFLSNMYNGNIEIFWYRILYTNSWSTSKIFENITVFLYDFFPQKIVLLLPDRNVSIPLDKNISILLASNINNGNIETFWYKELYMKDLP